VRWVNVHLCSIISSSVMLFSWIITCCLFTYWLGPSHWPWTEPLNNCKNLD
jgi:hypothetical protein